MFNFKKMTEAIMLIVLLTLNAEVKEQGTAEKNMLTIKAILKFRSSLLSIRLFKRREFKSSIRMPIIHVLESTGAKNLQPLLSF